MWTPMDGPLPEAHSGTETGKEVYVEKKGNIHT